MKGKSIMNATRKSLDMLCLFTIVLSVAMPCSTYAGDDPVDPRLGRKTRLMAKSSSSGLDAPKASDIMFVTDSSTPNKGDLGQYLDGTITIPLEINRYFGDKKKLIKSEAIPKKVAVEFVTYDVDEDASYNPEVDYMYFNGKKIGQLRGSNGNYHRMLFLVDIDNVNLPTALGATAQNTITVQVDVNNGGWLTSIEWISIYIPAAPPVILAHGINSSGAQLATLAEEIEDQTGLPTYHYLNFNNHGNDHIDKFSELAAVIQAYKKVCGVDHVNIVGHSMGGLRARGYAENANDVFKVLQVGTPNGGSPIADFVVRWKMSVNRDLLQMKENGVISKDQYNQYLVRAKNAISGVAHDIAGMNLDPWGDPAVVCLQTSEMRNYNNNHKFNSEVDYKVVAGKVTKHSATTKLASWFVTRKRETIENVIYEILSKYTDGDYTLRDTLATFLAQQLDTSFLQRPGGLLDNVFEAGDLIVPVYSAHTKVTPLAGSPLEGKHSEVWHSGLIEDGASRVVKCLKPKLVERKTVAKGAEKSSAAKSISMSMRKSSNNVTNATTAGEESEDVSNSIQTGVMFSGDNTSTSFDIVQGHHAMVVLDITAGDIMSTTLKLKAPSGMTYDDCAQNVLITNGVSNAVVMLANPENGKWVLEWKSEFSDPTDIGIWTLSALEVDDGVEFSPKLASASVAVGGAFTLTVSPKVGDVAVSGTVRVLVTSPDGTSATYDAEQDVDGMFSLQIPAVAEGRYSFVVMLDAVSPSEFSRSCITSGVAHSGDGRLMQPQSVAVKDEDANGMYDSLTVNFAVNATKSGTYRVIATLSDVEGNEIAEGWTSNIVCSAGTQTFTVEFDGRDIYNNGKCGGYVVSSAKLIEIGKDYEAVVDERENLFTTTDYSYEQFEHSLVGLSSGGYDSAVDSDGDGVYDKLNVTIPIYADDRIAGNYSWSASLFDSEGNTLSIASGNLTFTTGEGGTSVMLSFPGQEIAQTDLDGPFYIKSFIIWNYNASYSLSGEYATQPYPIKQWGGTPRHKPRYDFVEKTFSADEGEKLVVTIAGGDEEGPCSMQLHLTYNTASAADLDLAKGSVNGEVPKGGLKFPLTVSWAAGETGEKTVEIPVKADTSLEPDEFFTLQIANPSGMDLGDFRVCTATIHDRNTSVTLADAINNQSLKSSTSGSSKWAAVESWVADPDETHCAAFAESPSGLLAGKTATLSLGTLKGAGTLSFDMRFVGDDVGGASFVEVYDGKKLLKTFTMSANGSGWVTCQVYSSTSGSRTLSIVVTQGLDPASRVRITNVVWKPSSSYYFATLDIETYPAGAGFASGSGTYASGSKVTISATPRPGHTFVGWYYANGYLFSADAKTTCTLNWDIDLIALFARDPYIRGLADPADAGKVTGSGQCPSGKKVTLKATANKGHVFVGWYDERETRVTQAASLMVDNSSKPAKPSATTYVVTNAVSDATYYARFVTAEEDKASISLTVGGNVFPVGSSTSLDAEIPCGVWVDWPVVSAGLSQTTVKVSGLPSGLKYNANTGSIEGAVSAPSKKNAKTGAVIPSVVKITVTTAGKSTKDFVVNLTIAEMSPEAVGTFNGFVSPYDSSLDKFYRALSTASFTLTTTSAGKIAAKTDSPKGAVSFSSNYWDQFADGMYSAFLVARTGEMMFLYVDGKPQYWNGSNHAYGLVSGGSFGSEMLYVEAQRSSFLKSGKDYEHPEAVELASAMQGTYRFDAEYLGDGAYDMVPVAGSKAPLTLTIKNTGAVTVAGTIPGTAYKFSATGTLRVYPSSGEAQIFAGGKSGKSVNVMVILNAALDPQTGSVGFSGNAFVNMVK